MDYCLGFITDEEGSHVLLMEKRRPSWQAGQFNGIGGKVEGFIQFDFHAVVAKW